MWNNRRALPTVGITALVVFVIGALLWSSLASPDATTPPPRAPVASAPAASDTPPNILIILTDDQSQGTMDAMPRTQELIADEGITLENYVIPTSACCPSRASLLTGQFAHTTGVYSNRPPYGAWKAYRKNGNEEVSLPVWLHAAGYRTGLFGKYLNGYNRKTTEENGVPPGWDEFVTFVNNGPTGAYYDYFLSDGTFHGSLARDYSTDVLSRRVNTFLATVPDGQPFFAYFAPYAPHSPHTPAPSDAGSLPGWVAPRTPATADTRLPGKPAWMRENAPLSDSRRDRLDRTWQSAAESLKAVDDAVASAVDLLDRTGRLSNTLIVFASDNGYMWGAHRLLHKMVPYDMATRVPAFVRWDGHLTPGTADTAIVTNTDLTATIVDAAQLAVSVDGYSLLGSDRRTGTVLESAPTEVHPAYCGWRDNQYLFVRWATGEEELYDYRVDPWEQTNQAYQEAYADQTRTLRAITKTECSPTPPEFSWGPRAAKTPAAAGRRP